MFGRVDTLETYHLVAVVLCLVVEERWDDSEAQTIFFCGLEPIRLKSEVWPSELPRGVGVCERKRLRIRYQFGLLFQSTSKQLNWGSPIPNPLQRAQYGHPNAVLVY